MAERRDYIALDWVAGEIGETLEQAGQALAAFRDNPEDLTRLRFCLTHLHQVSGTLKMVEFSDAALLAEEAERLAQNLLAGKLGKTYIEDALTTLASVIQQLPAYLDGMRRKRRLLPAALIPLLNDLRAVRSQPLISETPLFTPALPAAVSGTATSTLPEAELLDVARKLRQMYQIALLGLLKGEDERSQLNYLAKVFARMARLAEGQPSQPLWRIAIAICEGLLNRSISRRPALNILLRQLDGPLRELTEQGSAALASPAPERLLRNLLFYVAASTADSRYIAEIKRDYALGDALPGAVDIDSDIVETPRLQPALAAIRQRLADAATQLDSISTPQQVMQVVGGLKPSVDASALLGLATTSGALQQLLLHLARLAQTEATALVAEARAAATQLREHLAQLQPEGAEEAPRPLFMDSEEAQEALDTAAHAVLRESRGSLEHAKEAVIEFVATQWNHDSIRDLPALLAEVRGSLQLAQHPRAAQVLLGCERYVREQLLAPAGVPEWQMLDTLADAITSVDYYLERLSEDPDTDNDGVLGVAEDSVAQLGYPVVPDYPQAVADADAADDSAGHAFEPPTVTDEADIPALSDTVTADTSFPERAGSEISEIEDAAYTLEDAAGDAQDAPEPEAPALPVYAEDYALADYEPAAATTTSAESSADADVDAPDPEIVEIFIEEAGEVLESLDATLPDWQNNWHDDEAQADIRRAFHTLKGSGRMVGATDIGEFAWAVENMLNRVIDGSRQLDQARVDTVLQARQLAGPLVEAFATGQRPDMREVQALIARAEALAEQQSPALAPEPDHSDRAAAAATEAVEPPLMTEVSEVAADGAGDDEDADDGDDTLLLEIFGGEASAHLEVLEHFIDHARSLAGPADLHDDLQRALHTLKGSAHMAGVKPVAAVVTPVESMIKELRAAQHRADSEIMATLIRLAQFIRAGIAQLEDDPYRPLPGADDFQLEVGELHQRLLTHLEQTEELGAEAVTQQAITRFLTDAVEQLAAVADDLAEWHSGRLSDDRQQSLATTLGEVVDQAETINQPAIVELASALQSTLRQAHEHGALPAGLFVLAEASCESLIDQLDRLAANQQPLLDQHLLNQLQDFRFGPGDADAPADTDTDAGPLAETDDADPAFIGDDSAEHAQEDDSEAAGDGDSNDDQAPEAVAPSLQAIDGAAEQEIDAAPPADEDLDAADTLAIETDDYPAPPVLDSDGELAAAIPLASENGPDTVIYGVDDTPASPPRSEFQPAFGASDDDDDDGVDQEILEIFLEEADDLLESIDAAAHAWSDDRDNRIYLEDLQRLLHTLKGGARLAGLTALGNLSHNFETFLINADQRGAVVDEAFIGKVLAYQDQLLTGVEAVKAGHSDTASDLPTTPEADIPEPSMTDSDADDHAATADAAPFETGDDADDAPSAAPQSAPARSSDNILPFARQADSQEMVPFTAPARELKPGDAKPALAPQSRRGPQEVVKVSAQLLEDLVNLAGETSIARGRAEEQVSELVFALDEMQITVDRLQEQVRRLDMETEAQIVFRQEQLSEGMEDFDPLEFDRYSVLQQLSRSLLESASDLVDIRSTLGERSRDMETVLVQQSRINTELQEGLMRSRMVPFSRMVPRLRRIVRQVSAELDKKVELYIDNAEGELDRSVLERIVAPLEHMLRNAVDHGIESQAQRRAAGKPEEGTIVLSLGREGGEVLLKLADDGAGINLDAVRDKAIERGLMDRSAQLSDREIMQFIMAAGFSTASQVSQISGRGVGMDVVASEIRQLGGSVEIQSEQGQGTTFLVRLPFTVSINRALMVSVAGDVYAIPLNTIEGIVRVSPFELEAYYQPDAPLFEYAGQPYLLRYMGSLLHTSEKPNLEGQSMPLPVLLVRGSDHSVAVQVDSLLGSREIVVKSLGPQFGLVQGLSGATVLGDGSVVVILDLLAMIRADASHLHRDLLGHRDDRALEDRRSLLVMVVDDSVTVRKVTSRFLERQGMEVWVAKDGADAMAQLLEQDRVPDIMLLDIEMPRMDGFEVASRVRHNSRMETMPIIMITSRTGEKHRERALSLGVNRYMGKPYQEVALLEAIQELTGVTLEIN